MQKNNIVFGCYVSSFHCTIENFISRIHPFLIMQQQQCLLSLYDGEKMESLT